MKILLFGGSGQLGFELKKRAADLDFQVISPVTSELNITEREQVAYLIRSTHPDVVMNCAAYTAVDKAEDEPKVAFAINRDGARNIAEGCKATDRRLIHISTDYVFDGLLGRPLAEPDPVNPVSVYGRSKLEGEVAITDILGEHALILRTSSLHGQKGVNFVHTMLKLLQERDVLRIVDDQIMSPTWAGWLAEAMLDFARVRSGGIVHASCRGEITWLQFASEIRRLIEPYCNGKPLARLEATTAAELNRPAKRPVYSAFNLAKITGMLGRPPLEWQAGLCAHLSELGVLEAK